MAFVILSIPVLFHSTLDTGTLLISTMLSALLELYLARSLVEKFTLVKTESDPNGTPFLIYVQIKVPFTR